MKRLFMVWIGFISICCSKVAEEGKSCPRLLVLQKVAQNPKSCSKVAEHNVFMPYPHIVDKKSSRVHLTSVRPCGNTLFGRIYTGLFSEGDVRLPQLSFMAWCKRWFNKLVMD